MHCIPNGKFRQPQLGKAITHVVSTSFETKHKLKVWLKFEKARTQKLTVQRHSSFKMAHVNPASKALVLLAILGFSNIIHAWTDVAVQREMNARMALGGTACTLATKYGYVRHIKARIIKLFGIFTQFTTSVRQKSPFFIRIGLRSFQFLFKRPLPFSQPLSLFKMRKRLSSLLS